MLFRQIPNSHKKRRAQLLSKRAAKRDAASGDAAHSDADQVKPKRVPKPKPSHRTKPPRSTPSAPRLALQSRFVSVPKRYLKKTRFAVLDTPLKRPLDDYAAAFPLHLLTNPRAASMRVPARPPFRFGASKAEVEANEESMFAEWLEETKATVDDWVELEDELGSEWVHSPTWFETNLEVWRQLWRVVESSSIVLLLMDARCPAVHCPPSLRDYIQSLAPRHQVILVLTKADLVEVSALEAWKAWLQGWWNAGPATDAVQVVAVNSYDTSAMEDAARARPKPEIPDDARADLVAALRTAHGRLASDRAWSSRLRATVHWNELERLDAPVAIEHGHSDAESEGRPLTVGLVGQPNVGKSSLLNALLGMTRVSTSRTPGKTKHFQTMFWGVRREVKIVDCPGLVCPSLVPMELQVMAGILPISKIAPVPSCVHFAARHMPLETMFRVPPPTDGSENMRWLERPDEVIWTTGAILEGRALDRGYYTAMGARPDTNRAGNGMLRALADGRVKWGFWPPDAAPARHGRGVWLDGEEPEEQHEERQPPALDSSEHDISERESSEPHDDELWGYESLSETLSDGEEDDDDEVKDSFVVANNNTFFAALEELRDEGDEDDEERP